MYENKLNNMKVQFLKEVNGLVEYWLDQEYSTEEVLEGLAFSMLSLIDGVSSDCSGYMLIPIELCDIDDDSPIEDLNISGDLHERFYDALDELYSKDKTIELIVINVA